MLNDKHLKVLFYERDAAKVFSNTTITGGVAITYRDSKKDFGAIKIFTNYEDLNLIVKKVENKNPVSFSTIFYGQNAYQFLSVFHEENPQAIQKMSKGHEKDIITNVFDTLNFAFYNEIPDDDKYIKIYGRQK